MRGRLFLGDGVGSEQVEVHTVGDRLVVEREGGGGEVEYPLLQAQVMLGGDRSGYVVFRIHGIEQRVEVWVERAAILWFLRQGQAPPHVVAQVDGLLAEDGRRKAVGMLALLGCGGIFFLVTGGWWALAKLGWLALF